MKKIWYITLVGLLVIILSSCASLNEYVDSIRPVAHAPALTENEAAFVEMIPDLKKAGIALSNTAFINGESETRRGSGVIVKKVEGTTNTTYYAITSQWVVESATALSVYTADRQTVTGIVLNPLISFQSDENIAIIRFSAPGGLNTVELKALDEDEVLDNRTIFSIATPISNGYLNYVTNPALIMGVYEDRIVHGTNLNFGTLGSPLYLKSTGQLIGINVKYSATTGGRPEVLINEAIHINKVINLVKGYL